MCAEPGKKPGGVVHVTDPLAWFLTWSTYGVWLPGDERGWKEYGHGWQFPAPALELECQAHMSEDACVLLPEQRHVVEVQIAETCTFRQWHLHAVNCRSNHIHVVVSVPVDVKSIKIRDDLKAWATRCLKSRFDPARENWWGERGSRRAVWNEAHLEAVIAYTRTGQDGKSATHPRVDELGEMHPR